jgi:hypothetical protein
MPSPDDIRFILNTLDGLSDSIPEGDYLRCCDILKQLHDNATTGRNRPIHVASAPIVSPVAPSRNATRRYRRNIGDIPRDSIIRSFNRDGDAIEATVVGDAIVKRNADIRNPANRWFSFREWMEANNVEYRGNPWHTVEILHNRAWYELGAIVRLSQ